MGGIREAGPADRDAVGELLHESFRDDPVSCWLFPEEAHREWAHRRLFTAFLDMGLAHGTVHVTDDGAGAAVWFSVRGGALVGEDDLGRWTEEADPGNKRLPELERLTGDLHSVDVDHAYLQAIAVAADRRGRGIGSALLEPVLDECDRLRLPAFLEASNPRSRSLYERHGFVFTGTAVRLPDGPQMWPMWREPV
ncbi:GNAT family N-acetyltransferase [Streptomyces armeniacus]|uniref:GNAT family N-acetyltransferase n=1 Tax=Streptomyces armeniacus TaxID=83291 RepID=A0A345XIL1_9ACTN|nr:GNAT family N-acetyltransferase [Streptomyces armeniacus]AXK31477.1 GNAT family N-acetyltransferase [Streptomyces armeniacus]